MDETSRSVGLSLMPVKSPRLGDNVEEYQLVGESAGCLQEILEFIRAGGAGARVIWITPNAFLCSGSSEGNIELPPDFDANESMLWFDGRAKTYSVTIAAATQDDRMDCLEFLLRQPDSFYNDIHMRRLGPLTPRVCKILLNRMSGTGTTIFENDSFSADCGRLFGACGSETSLQFVAQCQFEDRGEAFVNALSQRQDNKQPSLQHLSVVLFSSSMLDDQTSQLISMIKNRMLYLLDVQMVDYGNGLAASISRGQGPRGLHLSLWPPSSLEVLPVLVKALGDERCTLEKIIMATRIPDSDIIATALQRNRKLLHFELRGITMQIPLWKQLLRAISNHPTIRSLGFSHIRSSEDDQLDHALHNESKKQRTDDVVLMLTTNHRVVDFEFCPHTFDQAMWDNRVTPLLKRNRWREEVRYLWKVEPESTRASLLVLCLANVGSSPSTVYQLLSGNQGLIASYV